MKVKKYEAASMQEALVKIKSEMGQDAIILHTRKFIKGGIFGLFGKEKIEVLAGTDVNLADNTIILEFTEKFKSLQNEIKEVKSFIHTLMKQMKPPDLPRFPEHLEDWYLRLLQNEVEDKLAQKLIQNIQEELGNKVDTDLIRDFLIREIGNLISEPEPIKVDNSKTKVVALIGPTGVGKTTTIAKLASNFTLTQGKKVVLATADTYRIAAIEQLKTYAEIIQIPLEVAFTPAELKSGIEKHNDKDLILIDTAGRSQKNKHQMYELKDFLQESTPDEMHLVLSATTKYKDLLDIIEKFSIVPIDHILFTKLDETTDFGTILNILSKLKKPLSYVTTGQNVPEDIEVIEPKKLAKLIIGENRNG